MNKKFYLSLFLLLITINSSILLAELKIYYGGLHSHTSLSDGKLMPEDAFKQARDIAGADFWTVTDHTGSLESSENVDALLQKYGYDLDKTDVDIKFKITKIQAEKETLKDKFIAIRGFEKSGSEGHINVFNTDTFYKRPEGDKLENFYDWLRQYPSAIATFNHPHGEENFHNFEYFADLDPIINCVEVMNGVSITYELFISQYFMALDAGWHVGPTAVEDNHNDDWGATELRTAVFAENLTEENILNGLKNLHFYATPDKNLQIYFYANDSLMGSEITLPSTSPINFHIKVNEPDGKIKIDRIAIYTNERKLVKAWNVWKSSFETDYAVNVNVENPQLKTNNSKLITNYYVLEVAFLNFTKAITSPIWVNTAK